MHTAGHRTQNGKQPFPAGILAILAGGLVGWLVGSLTLDWVQSQGAGWLYSLSMAATGALGAHAFHWFRHAGGKGAARSAGDFGPVASRIAHDLRSPLAALDMIAGQLGQIPEEKRALIRSATGRIRDIANELILRHEDEAPKAAPAKTAQLLASLLDSLITEKRLEFRNRPGLDLDFRLHGESYGLFAGVDAGALRLQLSRLIDLSAASISAGRRDGQIDVRLRLKPQESAGSRVLIQLRDNGDLAIAESSLHELRKAAAQWGGELHLLAQRDGRGSTLTLELPREKAPGWFVAQLEFGAGGTVVIADDDASVHQMWEGRFRSAVNERMGGLPKLVHVSTLEELRKVARSSEGAKADLFLVDYEFIGETGNGLDAIEELGLAGKAILVTSRFEETHLRERCERHGVRLIPKSMSGFVPLRTRNRVSITRPGAQSPVGAPASVSISVPNAQASAALPQIDAILIDDDELVHLTWKIAAGREHKVLLTFRSVDEFLSIPGLLRLPGSTAIFVDSNLGNGVLGEQAAKALYERGFKNISLATGHAGASKDAMPEWIRRVVGKDPLFE